MGSGGTDKSAQNAQIASNEQTLALQDKLAQQARRDVSMLFPAAQDNYLAGQQAALNIFGEAAPRQADAFLQGNMGAQQQISRGLPQMQNALMGMPVDYSAFQPQQIQADTSWMQNVQIPQFTTPQQALALTPQEIQSQRAKEMQSFMLQLQQAIPQQPQVALGGMYNNSRQGSGGQTEGQGDRGGSGGDGGSSRGGRNSAGGARGDGPGGSV
jgi:hypothetical protein